MILKIIEFVTPIVLFIYFVLFPNTFILQSNTILGKLISIAMIVMYTNVNFLYGLFFCLMAVFYYQSDFVTNTLYAESLEPMVNPPQQVYTSCTTSTTSENKINSFVHKTLLDINKAYSREKIPIQSESETVFRNQHCNADLELTYKNKIIRQNDIIPNIFPEITFTNDNKPCNPCDTSCPFVIRSSLEKKDFIGQSTRGKTSLEEIMDWANSFWVHKNEPFSGVDFNVASYFS